MIGFVMPEVDYRVTVDGQDVTSRFRPRLIGLSLRSNRADHADQVDISLDDSDGRLALPKEGAEMTISIGWASGSGVSVGLVDCGSFTVDEIEHAGTPDILTLRGRSADFTGALQNRKEKSWHDTTIGAIVGDVAKAHKLQPRCAEDLSGIEVKIHAQSRESDIAMLRRLGREHDAVATIKKGTLIFAPIGAGKTAGGQQLPKITITRADGDRHRYNVAVRDGAKGVTASYHDQDAGERKDVTVGEEDGARRLSRTYASEDDAKGAAKASASRQDRAPRKFGFTFALGRADVAPEQGVTLQGFKPEIDAIDWIVVEVSHSITNAGFTTEVELEPAGQSNAE